MDFYGTIGPACAQPAILQHMVEAGMTGIRMNLSHGPLAAHTDWLAMMPRKAGIRQLLIDLQGPELRIGTSGSSLLSLVDGQTLCALAQHGIPCPAALSTGGVQPGQQLLLDDGKLLVRVDAVALPEALVCTVVRGGTLQSRKSIGSTGGRHPDALALTTDGASLHNLDHRNAECGVTGCHAALCARRSGYPRPCARRWTEAAGIGISESLPRLKTLTGVQCPAGVHAAWWTRWSSPAGDLGNAMPLWELPRCQKQLSAACRAAGVPFMVVTQMLDSMCTRAVHPRRGE